MLLVFLSATVAVDWRGLQTTQQFIYVVLIALAAFMVTRVLLAFRVAQQQGSGWESRYMNHIYFTYISLWARSSSAAIPQDPEIAVARLMVGERTD